MTYHWQLNFSSEPDAQLNSELAAIGAKDNFPSQAEAEAWLGMYFMDLQEFEVESVVLRCGDEIVLGPMPLADS